MIGQFKERSLPLVDQIRDGSEIRVADMGRQNPWHHVTRNHAVSGVEVVVLMGGWRGGAGA